MGQPVCSEVETGERDIFVVYSKTESLLTFIQIFSLHVYEIFSYAVLKSNIPYFMNYNFNITIY
jgi:hypothetical protein